MFRGTNSCEEDFGTCIGLASFSNTRSSNLTIFSNKSLLGGVCGEECVEGRVGRSVWRGVWGGVCGGACGEECVEGRVDVLTYYLYSLHPSLCTLSLFIPLPLPHPSHPSSPGHSNTTSFTCFPAQKCPLEGSSSISPLP